MSIDFCVEKINTYSNTRKMVDEAVAIEAPVNIFINDEYVITLLSTPEFKKELALGWLYDEGVLESTNQLKQININQDNINITTKHPIPEEKLRVVSVSRLITTACGLSAKKF
ncbi:formate dehydrogenase accessory sulfurtransferase FdhD, partial [Candidatus Bathyarchaeota archaeon]|nr:formate dehydrogenase accessory sulfurtransferase FdhD [Candidatus Bathyarchaeota archaeon]